MVAEREDVPVASRAQWRDWLVANAATSGGCWAVTWRRGRGRAVVTYDDLVEEALCVGWVDSRGRKVDEDRTALLFTPRRPGSGWSRPNKERIARLEAAGLLLPAGVAVVEAARADGSWTLLDAVEALEEPPDLAAALDALPAARAAWAGFPRSAKRSILEWIVLAKRPATRAKRIAETAELAAQGLRANQPRPPGPA
jgi:uncharacterized protein YdeI (YjbR/CyaY-like superfamily)